MRCPLHGAGCVCREPQHFVPFLLYSALHGRDCSISVGVLWGYPCSHLLQNEADLHCILCIDMYGLCSLVCKAVSHTPYNVFQAVAGEIPSKIFKFSHFLTVIIDLTKKSIHLIIVYQRASEASELSHCSCQSRFQIRIYIYIYLYVAVRQPLHACPGNHC